MEKNLRKILISALRDISSDHIEIIIPKDENHGDLCTPVAMSLAKKLKKSPKLIAEKIIENIEDKSIFQEITIAGAGFINFKFTKDFLSSQAINVIADPTKVLLDNIGYGKRVQIEFVSANPTGPLHLGHGRGAALGSALSNILKAGGFDVIREYYINDAGRQISLLGESVYAVYRHLSGDACYVFPEDGYKGEYIKDIARELFETHKGKDITLESVTDFSYQKMLTEIKCDLEAFGIIFDSWQSEKELYKTNEVQNAISYLKDNGFLYERDGALWFKTTVFGDDKDRVVIKNNLEYTYFAPDIAYHRKKIESGFDEIIDIWGADHHGYIARMQAAMQAFGYKKESFSVIIAQMVSLLRAGRPVQMSKRAGEFITLREVIDEIGADTTKFLFLTRKPDSHLEIDIETAKAQSADNPVYYVQYAYARINSIMQKAASGNCCIDFTFIDNNVLTEEELRLIKKVLQFQIVFKGAVLFKEPHRITYYLQDLASQFHNYYHHHRVITEDTNITKTRLTICAAVATVIKLALTLLGVKAPEKM